MAGLNLRFQQKSGGDDAPADAKAEADKRDGSAGKPPRPSRAGEGGGNKAALPIKITGAQFLNNLMLADEKKKAGEAATGKTEGAGASQVQMAERKRRRSSRAAPDGAGPPGAAPGSNPALKDALANLIAVYGRQPAAGPGAGAGDTEAVAVFKKAFKLRLQK